MAQTYHLLLPILLLSSLSSQSFSFNFSLSGIIFPSPLNLNSNCQTPLHNKNPFKLHLKHPQTSPHKSKTQTFFHSAQKDSLRIQSLFRRATQFKPPKQTSPPPKNPIFPSPPPPLPGFLSSTVESGVPLGSGEYFIDVFIGTPPQHFSLILDTGSDLNWLQCIPCFSCFNQTGPIYNPSSSSSYQNISSTDPLCNLVSPPENPAKHHLSSCPYFYWYGDHSNTTGDLATEIFSVNFTDFNGENTVRRVKNVIFGCGHWNRGLFHGAAGLLGLGRGPLSFASQLRSVYGDSFSYCFVDRNSDLSVSSKLIFGEDPALLSHPKLNFTSFCSGKENFAETFYYVKIRGIRIGDEDLEISKEVWEVLENGAGGTIVDSGTTLSYFSEPAYSVIRKAIEKKVRYDLFEDFPVLSPCYNVSGVGEVKMPTFSIVFFDGAVWDFPVDNYFIRFEPESIMCLAIMGTPKNSLSIIGNYQQQNFHVMYDMKNSRLGFAPMKCAEV